MNIYIFCPKYSSLPKTKPANQCILQPLLVSALAVCLSVDAMRTVWLKKKYEWDHIVSIKVELYFFLRILTSLKYYSEDSFDTDQKIPKPWKQVKDVK